MTRLSLRAQRAIEGYVFISPWIVGFLVFLAGPLVGSLYLSFFDYTAGAPALKFVGMKNYVQALVIDVNFLPAFLQTLGELVVDVPVILVFALLAAILANQRLPGLTIFRVIFFLPVVIGSALVIQQLFDLGVGGLALTGSAEISQTLTTYLGSQVTTVILDVLDRLTFILWRSGVPMLIFLAGLKAIPPHFYEAGRVDGASGWLLFWKITVPLLSPVLLVSVIYAIVDSFTDTFNRVLKYVHDVSFTGLFQLGYGAAMGWIYFAAILVLLFVVVRWLGSKVYYAGER